MPVILTEPCFRFSDGMKQCRHRMVKYHARTGIAHNLTDTQPLSGSVAMNRTLTAGVLILIKRTFTQTFAGIIQKPAAIAAKIFIALPVTAVQTYHLLNRPQFFVRVFVTWHFQALTLSLSHSCQDCLLSPATPHAFLHYADNLRHAERLSL